MKWETSGIGSGPGTFEMVQIGGVSYLIVSSGSEENECLTFSESGSAPEQAAAFSPDTFLAGTDLASARRIRPNENINGVMTRHYRITAAEALLFGLSNYTVDIWIAVDGGHPVRQTLVADGPLTGFATGDGHIEWTYDLLDINGPVDIQAPAGCDAPVGLDFPTMPDATEVSSFGSIVSYTSASSAADIAAFYKAELPAQGWVLESDETFGEVISLGFARDAEQASITIVEGDGVSNVLITIE